MPNTEKTNPSTKRISRPNLPQSKGNDADNDRSHIVSGPQRNPKPAK
jgi:hypothetical protein